MGVMRHILTGFFGGELDPLMNGRVDTDNYSFGLETCENFIPINEGPLVKRGGFAYNCDADPTSTWLSNFRFSITQDYLLEWGEQQLRFFTNGARIETSPGVAYEVTTPYPAADVHSLSFQQSYDRLYIDHGSHPPASINRTGALSFGYTISAFEGGPFLDQNGDKAVTVTASVAGPIGGATTITATAAIFVAGMVGALFRIEAEDFSDIKAWEAGMKAVAIGEIVRSQGNAYQAETAGITGSNVPIHTSGSEWDGQGKQDELNVKGPYGVKWKHLHGRFGIVQITGIGVGGTTATGTIVKRLPNSVTSVATHRWAHAAWSNAKGWPHLVVHAYGRQIHFKDFDIFGSVAGAYRNHAALTESGQATPDMAFRRTMDMANPPIWAIRDLKRLILGTADGEFAIGAINAAVAVSGDNIQSEAQSDYGVTDVWPVKMGIDTAYVELGGRRIRAANYDFARDRYVPNDLTAAARHVTQSGIRQLVYQRLPYSLLHAVRGDGQIALHPHTRLDIKGFARILLGGGARVLSAATVFNDAGDADELWLLVERRRGASGPLVKEIWKQAPWRELGEPQEEAFFVDGGVSIDATAGQLVFGGLAHLAGQDVAVLANGGVVPNMSVSPAGVLTLPATAVPDFDYKLIVGLPYSALAITMTPELRQRGETVQGVRQRLLKVALRVLETLGARVGDKDGPHGEVIDRPGNAAMDRAIPLYSGETEGYVDAEYARRSQAVFRSDDPLPFIVTAAMMNIDVDMRDV